MCNSHQPPLVTRRSNKALPIPNVPVADPIDGLLTLEDLQQPVVLNLVVWPEAAVGHSYQLTWNSVLTGEKKYITTEQPGDALTLDIPPGLLASDGNYDAGYGAINEVGGQTAYSPEIPLIVDRTAPGGTLLAAMVFPVETHDGVLTSAELTALGDVLTTEVPGYTGMAWGDRIRTFWGDVVGPEHTVTTSEVNEDLVMLNFTRAFLESLGDVEEPAYFTVTDRAGNVSINSLSKTFKLFLQEIPQDYPAPVCVQADDGVIDDADARAPRWQWIFLSTRMPKWATKSPCTGAATLCRKSRFRQVTKPPTRCSPSMCPMRPLRCRAMAMSTCITRCTATSWRWAVLCACRSTST
jgi:hypothetical protein